MRHKLFNGGLKEITKTMILGMYLNEKYDFEVEIEEEAVTLVNPNMEALLDLQHQLRKVPTCKIVISNIGRERECKITINGEHKKFAIYNLQFNTDTAPNNNVKSLDVD